MGRFLFDEPVAILPIQGAYTPGIFTNTTVTVNNQGIITDISNGIGGSGVAVFNDLTDVNLTDLSSGQFIRFDGSNWLPETLDLNDIDDVIITTPIGGNALRFDGSNWLNVDGVFSIDIGVTVQAWDAQLDGLASLDATSGFMVQTGPSTFVKRTIGVISGSGIIVLDGNGSSDPMISFDMTITPLVTSVDPIADFLLIRDTSTGVNSYVSIQNLIDVSIPVTDATNVGTGADIFKGLTGTTLVFRTISSASSGLIITNPLDDVILTLDSNLDTLAGLTPTLDSFIVGDGSGNWSVETPSLARTSLGLGTMALEAATDYLPLAGGTMVGTLDMGTNVIINVVNPTSPQDAATKFYVDGEITGIVAGAGLVRTTTTFNVGQNGDNSITVNADDIQLNTVFTDALYYTQTELSSDGEGIEGADLIGTDTKIGLANAITVEEALDYLDANLPIIKVRFRQDISVWNLDITSPSAERAVVNNVEVARFLAGINSSIYKDFLLPADYDASLDLTLQIGVAKETTASGSIEMALAFQHQRTPGFSTNDVVVFNPGATNFIQNISWVIPGGSFQALDVVTLRLSRLGGSIGDDYVANIDFFASFITQ